MGQLLPDPGETIASGAVVWRATPAGKVALPALGAFRFDLAPEIRGLEVLKRKPDRLWGRLRTKEGDYFVKTRKLVPFRRRLRTLFHSSAVREEWRKAWWLHSKGIETPEPVAVGEVRRHGMLRESIYICRWIEGARPLRTFLEESALALAPREFERLKHRLTEDLGRLLGSLHEVGAYHWEFHDMNVLVAGGPEAPAILPIDLDHLVIPELFSEADRAWNFHQLAWYLRKPIARWKLGRRDLIRFIRGYHASAPACASGWKDLFRRMSASFSADPPAERRRRRFFKAPAQSPSRRG